MSANFEITLPYIPPKELSPNYRGHWTQVWRAKQQVKRDISLLTAQALRGKPPMGRVCVRAKFVFTDRRRRDVDNFSARLKPAIDGLVDGGLVGDDSSDKLVLTLLPFEYGDEAKLVITAEEV